MTAAFKDNFSKQATEYARFRPRYPEALFRYLADLCENRRIAWDCGTGNGQCAVALTEFFDQVIATDASQKQLDNAKRHPQVKYRVATAEESGLTSNSFNLVTVAQALHWFRINDFWKEVQRTLQSGGVIAVWCYGFLEIEPQIYRILNRFYSGIVGPYWDFERKLVEEGYCSIAFPFAELESPPFAITTEWSLPHLLGYLRSWSATQKYIAVNGRDPIDIIAEELATAWGNPLKESTVKWPLSVRVGRI